MLLLLHGAAGPALMHPHAMMVAAVAAAPAAVIPAWAVEIDSLTQEARRNPLLVFAEGVPERAQGGGDGGRALRALGPHGATLLEALHEIHGLALFAGR